MSKPKLFLLALIVSVGVSMNTAQAASTSVSYFESTWGSEGNGDGEFNSPLFIELDDDGNIYVADTGNHRIQKFDGDGNYILQWGSLGSGDGQFNEPQDIAIDSEGNVYIVDRENGRIQKFDGDGNIYIADYGNDRIQKFAQTGLTPIYRLYNTRTGAHLYTRGVADRDKILNKFSDFEFTDGGPAFYATINF